MTEFMRDRVTIERLLKSGAYTYDGAAWVAVAPLILADPTAADSPTALPRWRVTMRKRDGVDLKIRLVWRGRFLNVQSVIADTEDPSRIVLECEETK
ncbi:MAG: phage head completion protein [Shewanella sp.]